MNYVRHDTLKRRRCGKHAEDSKNMPEQSNTERRKQLVRTMNELGDLILTVDELAKGHVDSGPARKGFSQIITSIKVTRDALQVQYNELLTGGTGG
jgi:hypothetical protein